MKIEPMTVQEIKESVTEIRAWRRLILAWVDATARADEAEMWLNNAKFVKTIAIDDPRRKWTREDWLADVLKRIGWPTE